MVGEPSPCDSFTLEKLSHNKAIMFGGCGTEEEMYIAKLTRRIVASALISVNIIVIEEKTFVTQIFLCYMKIILTFFYNYHRTGR